MSDKKWKPVASIHTHFNIFRDVHEAKTGDVTLDEQFKAMERFIRWHERQVRVGKQLLGRLEVVKAAQPTPLRSAICSKCGEPAEKHGNFGFRDHVFVDEQGQPWDIDWNPV